MLVIVVVLGHPSWGGLESDYRLLASFVSLHGGTVKASPSGGSIQVNSSSGACVGSVSEVHGVFSSTSHLCGSPKGTSNRLLFRVWVFLLGCLWVLEKVLSAQMRKIH